MKCEQVKLLGGEMECVNSSELKSLRDQIPVLTEALRAERAKAERYRDAENRHLRSKLSALTEERDRYREALKKIRKEDGHTVCGMIAELALSLSPLPEREAEREAEAAVLKAAEEWYRSHDKGNHSFHLSMAVRHLRTLKKG